MDIDRLLDERAVQRLRGPDGPPAAAVGSPAAALGSPGATVGSPLANVLRIAGLAVGQVGVLEGQVRTVSAARPYQRKRGGEGLLGRVTLADATCEVDLVLWDDEIRLCRDGPLQPGAFVRIHGPTVKAGYRGGVELGLGSAEVVAIPSPGPARRAPGPLEGMLLSIGNVRAVGAPPAVRFTCDLVVKCATMEVRVTAWDDAVKQARACGVGTRIRIPTPLANPFLEGWWTATTVDALTGKDNPANPE